MPTLFNMISSESQSHVLISSSLLVFVLFLLLSARCSGWMGGKFFTKRSGDCSDCLVYDGKEGIGWFCIRE